MIGVPPQHGPSEPASEETSRVQSPHAIRFRPVDNHYQVVVFEGLEYTLTPTQSTVLRVLHQASLGKRGSVGIKEIREALGVNSGKMSDWFRGKNKKLYRYLILKASSRHHYRLDL